MPEPLSADAVDQALQPLDGWTYQDDQIHKTWKFDNFKKALAAIVQIGLEAEGDNHHPTLTNTYNQVKVSLNTHDAGDKVTQKDIDLAARIDEALGS